VGLLDSVQQGSALLIESLSVFLCRDQAGYFAVDAECTHIGTMVEWSQGASKFECPLHGATYSLDGANLTGPATIPLKHYSLCVTASGSLVVDTSLEVPAATRLKA
jgi:cytochrome b6-f complex iron-sulfur subunit